MDDNEIGSPTQESLQRPDKIFPPGSPCSSLKGFKESYCRVDADGEQDFEEDSDAESPTKIFDSPMSPDNQKLSELLVELAETDEDYIGSEVESEFAVWEKNHKITSGSQNEFPSPHDRPPLFVREDGTPTPGSLAPFWNRAIVLNMRNIVDEDGPDKDGPGNHFSKKRTKPSPMGKKNPVTVGVYKDQLYAFNNGAAKESGNLSQFWYKETSVMRLIPGREPYVTPVVDPAECTDIGTEMSISPKGKKEFMTDPLVCYMCSKYPAYLILDYKHTPKLIAMRKSELTAKLEDIKKRNSTLAEEKISPLVNIRKTDAGSPDCVLYFKTGDLLHFVQVDQGSRKLTINTQSNKEKVEWRSYRHFKEKTFKGSTECNDAPDGEESQPLETGSKPAPVTSSESVDGEKRVERALKDLEIKQEPESTISPCDRINDDSTPEDHFQEKPPKTPLSETTNHDHKEFDASMPPHSPVATDESKHSLLSNGVANKATIVHTPLQ